MIWFTLALFVISFLVVALLAPKPEIENARAQTLDDVSFPRATEDAPIPLILGKVRMVAPNVTWYGNFRTVPIREKIKTGLFSSTTVTVAHRYFLTMDLALAMGPGVVMREVYVDDKIAWTGTTSGAGVTAVSGIGISFGGYKEGGAMSMGGNFYSGSFDIAEQPVDPIIEGQVGVGNVPAMLGTAHISLDGELGESAQLRKMAFVLECYTNGLGLVNNGRIGDDMNPAEALYQIMTDNWRGLGIAPSLIDIASLQAIGQVLYDEGNGVSVQVTAEATGKKVVEEILRQIDGVAYQDPATGRIIFKLIRDDYDVDLLDIYDETDIIKIENFSRSGWDEVMAQVKISFPQRDKDSDAVAISQDMATAGMVGRLRSTTIAMPFCYDKNLANKLASRERAQLSVPLFRMTLQMNRNANTLRPGDVFKVSWADYGISELVMRVQEFDFGSLLDGKLVIRCLQDNFALDTVVFLPPPDSGWVAPIVDPQPIAVSDIIEMPRFFMNRLQFPIPDGNAGVIPMAIPPSTASSGFDLLAGDVSGDLDVREPQQVSYPASGTLLSGYDRLSGFSNGYDTVDGFTLINTYNAENFVAAGSEAEAKQGEVGLLYGNGEFMAFRGFIDNGNGSYTFSNIYRGLLGTSPKTHPIGTRFYQLTPDLYGLGTLDDLAEDDTLYYKLLDRVGPEAIDEAAIVEASQLMARWARRPQRVRNLQLDGNRTNIIINNSTGAVDLTFARSNREASEIAIETDPDQVPNISDALAENYDVQVYNNGILVPALGSVDNAGSPININFSATSLTGPGEIRLIAQWDYDAPIADVSNVDYAFLPVTFDQVILIAFADLWDTYGEFSPLNLKGVYGLRRRVSDYTGPLIRIRDDFDDSEQDVGQNEIGALASFTVTGNPYIVTVYDQSGEGLDVTAPTNADQPLLGAHPFRNGDYAMSWDGVDDILRGPTFNSASPNAHAIDRPMMWIGFYRTNNPSGNNEYLLSITHDVGENPALTPFAHTGFVHQNSTNAVVSTWNERDPFYVNGNLQLRGMIVYGEQDASNLGMYIPDYSGAKVIGTSLDWTVSDSSILDFSGVELKALEVGNRTDQALPFKHEIFEFGIAEKTLFTGTQATSFMNAMMKEALSRETILINDAVPSTTEWAQGGAYPASALNPDHEVYLAFYVDDETLTDVDLSFEFYDVDFVDEIGVYLNGNFVGYANTTSNNAWGSRQTFATQPVTFGWNIICVRQEQTLTFVWGVRSPQVASAVNSQKKLWASFEGADAATAYTERSYNKRSFTFVGNAQLDDAQKKFGSTSLLLDGTGDQVTLPNDADWQFGNDSFTVEGHFRWNSVAAATWLLANYSTGGNQRSWGLYWDGSDLRLVGSENGSTVVELVTPYTWTPTVNTWYHITGEFDGTTYRLYVDGVVVATGTTVRTLHNSTDLLRIGAAGGSSLLFNGWIDEVKIYKGKALYAGTMIANGSEF
jgi:hypothetical protein